MNTFITEDRRQELIDQYIDYYMETDGMGPEGLIHCLTRLTNSELVRFCQDSGWDIT